MRILMLTASLPYPPHQGGAIRAYGILHGLHAAGHEITLLSFNDPEHGVKAENTPLIELCDTIITLSPPQRSTFQRLRDLVFTREADIARRLDDESMHNALKKLITTEHYDLIQFEGIEITNYLFTVTRTQPNIPTFYDSFNAEAALQAVIANVDLGNIRRLPNAIYSYIQSRRIARFERNICQAATAVSAVSEEDADLLRDLRPDKQVFVVPSGIFASDYEQAPAALDLRPNTLVFTGKMDYRPNVDAVTWFADHVLPRITSHTDAHFYIVGQKPHKRLDALRMNPNIHITGWVPDVPPYLHAADVYVAPLRMGSGTRLKILEAMAAGCAVVATPTAAAGLMNSAKDHMIITEDGQHMADAIRDLLQQPEKRRQLGNSARQYITQHYDWSVLIPRLLAAYEEIGLG